MKPQEKVKELVKMFDELLTYRESKTTAKQRALIAVDEIIKAPYQNQDFEVEIPQDFPDGRFYWDKFDQYWNEVKQEIENL